MKLQILRLLSVAAAILLFSCVKDDDVTVNRINPGDAVPPFVVAAPDGTIFNSSSFVGKRSLLLLFASWCPACQDELPYIEEVWQHFRDDADVLVVPLSRNEEAAAVEAYWQENSFEMPVFLDPGRVIFDKFANQTVPRIYLIDSSGVVSEMWVGKAVSSVTLIEKIQQLP